MTSFKEQIPEHLRRKLPKELYDPFLSSDYAVIFGLGFSLLSLCGPLIGPHREHNGWLDLLIGPFICPWFAVVQYHFFPFPPYKGITARYQGMENLDKHDPDARRLVEIYCSKEARKFLVSVTLKVCAFLFVSGALMAFIFRDSLSWSFDSSWVWEGAIGCCIGTFIVIPTPYIRWGILKWVEESNASMG